MHLDSARLLNSDGTPLVLLYAAKNTTTETLEQFMLTAFVFDAAGIRKGSQTAPGRRTLEAGSSKYSAMVLDGFTLEPTDRLVLAVQQAQRAGSEEWWRSNLLSAAEAAIKGK